jgi:hypothetical protein
MPSMTRKRSALILALATGLLAAAAPAHAGIAVGNPPGSGAASIVSPRDVNSGQATGVVGHGGRQPVAVLDAHMEI